MKRNTLFGGFSLLVAGAAIGAGAVASGSAMAGDGTPPADEGTVEVITGVVGTDGSSDAFKCVFDDVELGEVFEAAELPIPVDGEMVDGEMVDGAVGVSGVDGVVEVTAGSLPEGVELDEVAFGAVEIDGLEMIDPADVREGTPEECAGVFTEPDTTFSIGETSTDAP